VYWLDPARGTYAEFGQREWQGLVAGKTKL